ncbi:Arm DNA-binding domain-containing protein [Burkholderia perseverans]|uniref:Arm DNA-binding domain-containing protein n=1 Tax=Burkholderia perseverans TaxID=2615214 RepID=UPI001FEDDDE0|nr:Arm DNA-binding domain-containing protein [Burkholderia perseverans]
MARQLHRLTAMGIAKLVDPGYYADGGGLYLQITLSGSRSWVYKFMLAGRSREMGLGALSVLSLAAARKEAVECRALVKQGIDPIENRRRVQTERAAADAPGVTFKQAAEAYIADRVPTWRNAKHAKQWTATLDT